MNLVSDRLSIMNLHAHAHALVLDGVFEPKWRRAHGTRVRNRANLRSPQGEEHNGREREGGTDVA